MYIGRGRKRRATIAAFLAPTVVGFLLFSLIPIARSLYLSFTSWDILQPAEWVGLENYKVLLGSEEFWRVMRNTGEYIVLYVTLMLVSSLALAALLNRKFAGVDVYKVLFFLPVLTSWVAGSLIWRWILNHKYGLVNILLGHIGVAGPAWLDDKYWAMPELSCERMEGCRVLRPDIPGRLKGINHEY